MKNDTLVSRGQAEVTPVQKKKTNKMAQKTAKGLSGIRPSALRSVSRDARASGLGQPSILSLFAWLWLTAVLGGCLKVL